MKDILNGRYKKRDVTGIAKAIKKQYKFNELIRICRQQIYCGMIFNRNQCCVDIFSNKKHNKMNFVYLIKCG